MARTSKEVAEAIARFDAAWDAGMRRMMALPPWVPPTSVRDLTFCLGTFSPPPAQVDDGEAVPDEPADANRVRGVVGEDAPGDASVDAGAGGGQGVCFEKLP
jgi:hypothetical protein